jgi:phage terminase large subunit-like protein
MEARRRRLRRFQKLFAFLPKGAGKSPWGAGTALYLTLCDDEAAAEVYAVAGDTKQARVVHDNARIMVEESPDLLEMCEVLRDAIYHPASHSKLQGAVVRRSTKHGFRPHGSSSTRSTTSRPEAVRGARASR